MVSDTRYMFKSSSFTKQVYEIWGKYREFNCNGQLMVNNVKLSNQKLLRNMYSAII